MEERKKTFGIDPSCVSLSEVLSKDRFYSLPMYQRPYSWDVETVEAFVDSLLSAYGRKEDLFFGTILLNPSGGYEEVVDGQQRILTFRLLFHLLDLFAGNGDRTYASIQYSELSGHEQENLEKALEAKSGLSIPTKTLRGKAGKQFLDETRENLFLRNLCLMDHFLRKEAEEGFDFEGFRRFLEDHVYFVQLEGKGLSLSQIVRIFDSINTTGMKLNTEDLFKIQFYSFLGEGKDVLSGINAEYEKVKAANKESKAPYSIHTTIRAFRFYLYQRNRREEFGPDGERLTSEDMEESLEGFFEQAFRKWNSSSEERKEVFRSFCELNDLSIDIYRHCWDWSKGDDLSGNEYYRALEDKWLLFLFPLCWKTRYSAFWPSFFALAYQFKEKNPTLSRPVLFARTAEEFRPLLLLFLRASVVFDKRVHSVQKEAYDYLCGSEDLRGRARIRIREQYEALGREFETQLRYGLFHNRKRTELVESLYSLVLQLRKGDPKFSLCKQLVSASGLDIDHICARHDFMNRDEIDKDLFEGVGNLCFLPVAQNRGAGDKDSVRKAREDYGNEKAKVFSCCREIHERLEGETALWGEEEVRDRADKVLGSLRKLWQERVHGRSTASAHLMKNGWTKRFHN